MILMKWFNIYLIRDGFRLGQAFDGYQEAERRTDEFDCYHETILIPTDVTSKDLDSFNARIRTYCGNIDH